MTLEELRLQFEREYKLMSFSVERHENGEYVFMSTFQAWGGYKVCAKVNKILDECVDILNEEE